MLRPTISHLLALLLLLSLTISTEASPTSQTNDRSFIFAIVGVSALVLAILGSAFTLTKLNRQRSGSNLLTDSQLEAVKAEISAKKAELESIQQSIKKIEDEQKETARQKVQNEAWIVAEKKEIELQAKREEERLSQLVKQKIEAEEKRIEEIREENKKKLAQAETQLRERLILEDTERIEIYQKKMENLQAQAQILVKQQQELAKQQEDLTKQRSAISLQQTVNPCREESPEVGTSVSVEDTVSVPEEIVKIDEIFPGEKIAVQSSLEKGLNELLPKSEPSEGGEGEAENGIRARSLSVPVPFNQSLLETTDFAPSIQIEIDRPQRARSAQPPGDEEEEAPQRERSLSVADALTTNTALSPRSDSGSPRTISAVKFAENVSSPLSSRHKRNKSYGDFANIAENETSASQEVPMMAVVRKGGSQIHMKGPPNTIFSKSTVCAKCSRAAFGGAVSTPLGDFHPRCFICGTCNKPIKGEFYAVSIEEFLWKCGECHERENLKKPNFLLKKSK